MRQYKNIKLITNRSHFNRCVTLLFPFATFSDFYTLIQLNYDKGPFISVKENNIKNDKLSLPLTTNYGIFAILWNYKKVLIFTIFQK